MDAGVGEVKERRRGLSGGGLMMAVASCQLTGGDFLVSLDRRRADVAGQLLEPVATPAATTAAGIARRFTATHLRGIETAIGQVNTRMLALVGPVRRSSLLKVATIDGEPRMWRSTGGARTGRSTPIPGSATSAPTSRSGLRPGCRWPVS